MSELENNSNMQNEQSDLFVIKDILYACLEHWKWFVLSFVFFLLIAFFYIVIKQPVYERSASLMIKDDVTNGASIMSEANTFADMGLFSVKSNVHNELISIQSPALILDVVKRLSLDMNYVEKGILSKRTLYGNSLPVKVVIPGLNDRDHCAFKMVLNRENVTLSDFEMNNLEMEGTVSAKIGESVMTPIGNITLLQGAFNGTINDFDNREIFVSRSGLMTAMNGCSSRFTASIADKQSSVINLEYKDVSAQRAEDFLNTLIAVYNENWIRDKNQIAISTSHFINERLNVIEKELGEVDGAISEFKSKNLITDVNALSNMYISRSEQANSHLLDLNNQLYIAKYIKSFLASKGDVLELLPAITGVSSTAIEQQISEYNSKLLQRNSIVANSSDSNPIVVDYNKSLRMMQDAILVSIDNQISAIEAQIKGYTESDEQNRTKIASNPSQAQVLISIEREQKVKEALYIFLLQKREENQLSQAFTAYNTRIITPPMGSLLPVSPVKRNIILIAIFLGLLLPAGIIYLLFVMNGKVQSAKDIEKLTAPYVGEIPLCVDKKGLHRFGRKPKQMDLSILVEQNSRNIVNEAFRMLRTNIEFLMGKNTTGNVVMVTSLKANSGKSFITANLAKSFSIKGVKTVVVDLDLRHASASDLVSHTDNGVSSYLSEYTDDIDGIICNVSDNYDLLPCGIKPPNPVELLQSNRLNELLEELKKRYDIIFLDVPPINIVADTSVIAPYANFSLFVIRVDLCQKDELPIIEEIYRTNKLNNMSVCLNASVVNSRYHYGKYGKYGYYHDKNYYEK